MSTSQQRAEQRVADELVVSRRLRHDEDPDREDVRAAIYDYVAVDESFRTPDGHDAITVQLEEHGEGTEE